MNINEIIYKLEHTPSDINEHIPTLVKYASECSHITEMGVRAFCSTWAFIKGNPKKLICYDISHPSEFGGDINIVSEISKINNVDFSFILGDTTKVEIEPTDLLFIDTLHSYKQLKTELRLHANKTSKYIIMHDTTTFESGGGGEGDTIGLWPAIEEFLAENKNNWKLLNRYINNNGLTILSSLKI